MKKVTTPQPDIVMVDVKDLLPDFENPRITSSGKLENQEALFKELYEVYYLDDLIVSMSHNGYFNEEPLIGYESAKDGKGNPVYTIVEGNRRLAALRLLLFARDREIAEAKGLPEPKPEILITLRQVPVKIYDSRAAILPYMGVRHIAGVRPWDAMAKAKYIKYLIDNDYEIATIKNMVGVKGTGVVERWLLTLYVLNQANSVAEIPWDTAEESFKFSWLYTALGYSRIRQYLDMDTGMLSAPKQDPVPDRAHSQLIEHLTDLYGSPGHSELRKVYESREIKMLAAVYATPEALEFLRAAHSLADAYSKSVGEVEELVTLVREASYNLEKASGLAPHHKHNPQARRFAKRCLENAQLLYDTLED